MRESPRQRVPSPPRDVRRDVRRYGSRIAGDLVRRAWDGVVALGAIGPDSSRGRRFGSFGAGSIICFPAATILNERYIHLGAQTMIGPYVSLSAGMVPGQTMPLDPVVRIGDRCLIGKGTSIVGHLSISIGDDVWTGPNVYITDQNHDYRDVDRPISAQSQLERPVTIGDRSWLGYGVVVLPGATIGQHVAVAAGSVVTSELPDYSVAAGVPARPIRRWDGTGWPRV